MVWPPGLPWGTLGGVIAVTHGAARRNLRLRVLAAMACPACLDSGQKQVCRAAARARLVAARAALGGMRGMIEPAVQHIARGLGHRRHAPALAVHRRDHTMAL